MRGVAPWVWAASAGVLLSAVTACSSVPDSGSDATVAPSPDAAIESSVLVWQVTDDWGYAVSNVVIGTLPLDESPNPRLAYVPASLLVEVGSEPAAVITLGETPWQPDSGVPAAATSRALDIPVDGSVTMDRLAFAGLVDAVGGAWIELPAAEELPPNEEGEVVILPAGLVRLDGITAAHYVTAPRPDEPELIGMERFAAVLGAVLRRLPVSPERIRQLVTNLGSLSRSTVDVDVVVTALDRARIGFRSQEEQQVFVSVDVIRGGARPASVLNEGGSRTVESMFAPFESDLPDADVAESAVVVTDDAK